MTGMSRLLRIAALLLLGAMAGCSRESPINSPYPAGAMADNALYTAFVKRSPKYLDPASSYSTDETPYTYNIYEPLYGYHYLKRPYELVPRAAAAIDAPRYLVRRAASCRPMRRARKSPKASTTSGCGPASGSSPIRPLPGAPTAATSISRWPRTSWPTSSTFPIFPPPAAASWSPTTTSTRCAGWPARAWCRPSTP